MATSCLMQASTSRMAVATRGTTATTPGTLLEIREEHGVTKGFSITTPTGKGGSEELQATIGTQPENGTNLLHANK